jgi:hypothetical protein
MTTPMTDPAPRGFPGDIQVTDFDVSLEPGGGRFALRPVVRGLRLRLSRRGVLQLAQGLADEADRRAPVGVQLRDARVGPAGIDLYLRVQKGLLGGDLDTRLALSAPDGRALRVEVSDAGLPFWVPLEGLLDGAVAKSGGAVRRDPGHRHALLLDPAALLSSFGVPGRFAPGRWEVATSDAGIELAFREDHPRN